jgi:ankyrin repeat protein
MKLLVERKPYDGKYTPAALAAVAGADCLACVQIMIEQGMSKTALSDAFRSAALSARPEILNVLLKAGADVNAKDGAGSSALMRAVTSDFADVPRIQLFLDHGADVNLRDRNGDTALRKARQKGESQVAALLINAGEKE